MNTIYKTLKRFCCFWILFVAIGFTIAFPAHAQKQWQAEWPDTDFDKTSVDFSEIFSGGPPKDGIPAIDRPGFIDTSDADWLDPREPVIALIIDNEARAYPLQILMYHEIVNDTVSGVPVSVTFCPLCNASIVFDQRIDDRTLDFGTTGKLRKSDLVMYDRQTQSWWQQFTGEAIVGEMMSAKLKRLPVAIIAFKDFQTAYPQGKVLSRETGFNRPYGRNPYRGYDSIDDQPFLFDDPVDPRLPPMERVINISSDEKHRLYPFSIFKQEPVINDHFAGHDIVIFSREGTLSALDRGQIVESRTIPSTTAYSRNLDDDTLEFVFADGKISDTNTGSTWNLLGHAISGPLEGKRLTPVDSGVHFAFAWLAFNPDSEIYQRKD